MAPSKIAPAALSDGEVLFGTGDRVVKMNFYSVTLYSAALYGDFEKAKIQLKDYANNSLDDLLGDADFFEALVKAPFKKVLRLTMCRTMDKAKVANSFEQPLLARLGEDAAEKVKDFVGKLSPDAGFVDDDVLLLIFNADSKTLDVQFTGAKAKDEPPQQLVQIEDGAMFKAFLGIYFDADTELLVMKQGFISQLPTLFAPAQPRKLSDQESEAVASFMNGSDSGSTGQRRRRTWKERANRTEGGDGYSFGDLTKTLYYKLAGTPTRDYTNETCSEGDYPEGHWKNKHDEIEVTLASASVQLANAERSATLRLSLGMVFAVLVCLLCGQFLEKEQGMQAQIGLLVVFVLNSIRVALTPNAVINAKKDA